MKGVGGVMMRPKEIGRFRGRKELILAVQGMKFLVSGLSAVLMTVSATRSFLISFFVM